MKTRSMRGASLGQDQSFIHPDYGTINPSEEFQIHTSQPSVQCLVHLFILQPVQSLLPGAPTWWWDGDPKSRGTKLHNFNIIPTRIQAPPAPCFPYPEPRLSLPMWNRYVAQFAPLYLSPLNSEHIAPVGQERQQRQLQ